MQITGQLLQKFFNGQCTEAERLAVTDYFARFPEMLEERLTEEEWNGFQHHEEVAAEISARMFSNISRKTAKRGRAVVYLKYAAVAAVALIVSGTLWTLRPLENHNSVPMPVAAKNDPVKERAISWHFRINTTNKMIRVPLADGSTVELQPASEIKYTSEYARTDRNIFLKGNALFRVAAGASAPFTVVTDKLSTTALGTVFRVVEKNNSDVCVQLLQGRVVVKRNGGESRETYLSPGQQLLLSAVSGIASVQKTKRNSVDAHRSLPKNVYRFSDQPLAEILRSLETTSQLKFVYQDSLLTNLSFTGVFDENKEKIEDFISTICLLNDLIMEKKDNTIQILPDKKVTK